MKKIYVWWEWIDSWVYFDVLYPYDDSKVETVSSARVEDIELAITKAQDAFKETKVMPPYKRANVLREIVAKMKDRHEEFAEALTKENWKTISEARLEVSRAIVTFEIAIWEAERIAWEVNDLWVSNLSEWRLWIVRKFPAGIVAWITPFNFPLNLAAHKIAPAIATWCPIIIKPATATPLSMLMLAEIIEETELPKWAFSVVPCDRHTWQILVEDDRIAVLSFTWSPHVWWKMKKDAGRKKVVLELWGNAAAIIDKNVSNWEYVLDRTLMWAYYQAGQSCISVQRILVHEDIKEEFTERFIKKINTLKAWDPKEESTTLWPIIDSKNKDRLLEWVDEAVSKGAKLLTWGKANFNTLEATLLENVPKDSELWVEEAFWAVAYIETFKDIDEAISKVNDSKFGLQVGIFSDSISDVMKVFEKCEVWWVIQNDVPSFRADAMPYWWVKDSWLWREWIKYAMEDMLEEKVLVIKK